MVELKIITEDDDLEESTSKCLLSSARILCFFCNQRITVRQYTATKKDGSAGSKKWVLSNYDSHLKSHITKQSNTPNQNVGIPAVAKLTSFFSNSQEQSKAQSNEESNKSKSISGEASSRSCQERILLDEKKSSYEEKIQEAEDTKINEIDTVLQVINNH